MVTASPILISSRIFIPKKLIPDTDALDKHYVIPVYKDTTCHRCEIYKNGERHAPTCDSCPAFKGDTQLWRDTLIKGVKYVAVPPALPKRVARNLSVDLSTVKDLRPIIPMEHKIRFIGKLHDGGVIKGRQTVDQEKMVNDWLKHKTGIIQVPPRGGKTVIAAAGICEVGVKTVIICSLKHLLKQFRRTFLGNKKRKALTTARRIGNKAGAPVVGLVEKMSDFEGLDIALVNYQKFIRSRESIQRIFEYINGNYSLLVVDECHDAGAMQYARFISRLNCIYRMGLTATIDRKDGMQRIIKEYLGNVVAKSNITAMVPTVELMETGVVTSYDYKTWPYAMRFLAQNKARTKMIVREVFKDLRNKHGTIIIPVDFVKQAKELVELINRQAEINHEKRGEKWPTETAVLYSAVVKEDELKRVFGRVERGRHRVIVPIRKMMRVGVDLDTPTMIYIVVPMSAHAEVGAPMFYQLSHRVSTWAPNKRQPVVKVFIDGIPQSFYCFRSLFWQEILPGLRSSGPKNPPRYKMEKDEFQRGIMLAKQKEYIPSNKPGDRVLSSDLLKGNNGRRAVVKKIGGFSAIRRAM
jgi:hypothetical protein